MNLLFAKIGLVLILSLCCSLGVFSQVMTTKSLQRVIYEDETFDYLDMDDIFVQVPQADIWYQESKKAYKRSRHFGLASLASFGLGLGLILVDNSSGYCDTICLTSGDVIGAGLILIPFPILGTIGLINVFEGTTKKKKAIDAFNTYHAPSKEYGWQPKLLLGSTPNGLGLVYRF